MPTSVNFEGPFEWFGSSSVFKQFELDEKTQPFGGIYLWSIPREDDSHILSPHYIGRSNDIRTRLYHHLRETLSNREAIYEPERPAGLAGKRTVKVLHGKWSGDLISNPEQYSKDAIQYLASMKLFVAEVAPDVIKKAEALLIRTLLPPCKNSIFINKPQWVRKDCSGADLTIGYHDEWEIEGLSRGTLDAKVF